MNAIQVLLIAGLLIVLARLLSHRSSYELHAWTKLAAIGFFGMAIVAVVAPHILTRIANAVGVGRGADLLLYTLTMAFIFVVINQYLSKRSERRQTVKLARKIALLESELENARAARQV